MTSQQYTDSLLPIALYGISALVVFVAFTTLLGLITPSGHPESIGNNLNAVLIIVSRIFSAAIMTAVCFACAMGPSISETFIALGVYLPFAAIFYTFTVLTLSVFFQGTEDSATSSTFFPYSLILASFHLTAALVGSTIVYNLHTA